MLDGLIYSKQNARKEQAWDAGAGFVSFLGQQMSRD